MGKDKNGGARQPVSRTTRSNPEAPREVKKISSSFIKSVNSGAAASPSATPSAEKTKFVRQAQTVKAANFPPKKPFLKNSAADADVTQSKPPRANRVFSATNQPKVDVLPSRRRPALVGKAKKLALRSQNNEIKAKQNQLREKRDRLDDIEPIRLQKALAASGIGSRREAEEMIAAGQVLINGKVAELGNRAGPGDRITVKGKAVHLVWQDRLPRIIIYHKQEGEIVSRDDPEGRLSVFDRLPQAKSSRWVCIGRLDVNTSGLLILTTNGSLAHRFAHPSFEVDREYAVRILGRLTEEQRKALLSEVLLDDGPAHFDGLREEEGGEGANHWYRVSICEGRNREVRRVFESMGLVVSRLMRIRFGPIGLPARLKRGQFYELNEVEVANIMKWAKLDLPGAHKKRVHHE